MPTKTYGAALIPDKKCNVSPAQQFHGKPSASHGTLRFHSLSDYCLTQITVIIAKAEFSESPWAYSLLGPALMHNLFLS